MAVEMGLHSSSRNRQLSPSENDRRSRVFWTAYMIETSLAWNLGRPPSLDDSHITINPLDSDSGTLRLAIHHLHHRRIQGKIINTIYATNFVNQSWAIDPPGLVDELQRQLDNWRDQLHAIFQEDVNSAYPMKYTLSLSFTLYSRGV